MVKLMENLKHLLEESEELLMSVFDNGMYHFLVYQKEYNLMLYFQAEKYGDKFVRTNEDVITKESLRKKLSHILSDKVLKFLEEIFPQYGT